MLFCHFAKSAPVRDISNGLGPSTGNLNHLGVRRAPSKSSIGYRNGRRDAALFKALYHSLLDRLGQQTKQKQTKLKIKTLAHLLAAAVTILRLSVFDRAAFRERKRAVKMHTLPDHDGKPPTYVNPA